MTRLEIVRHAPAQSHGAAELIDVPGRVHLKCPACLIEFDRPKNMKIDTEIECNACGVISEFRELHEAWCLSRRPSLAKAFPEMDWQTADYVHSDICKGGATGRPIA